MDFKPIVQKSKIFMQVFIKRYSASQISNNSIVLSYYLLLSIFPALMFFGSLLPILNIDIATVLEYIKTAIPNTIYDVAAPFIRDFLGRGNGGLLSIGALLTLYSASKAMVAFQNTINQAYGISKRPNMIISRILAFVLTLLIIAIIAALIFFFSFGQTIVYYLTPIFKLPGDLFNLIGQIKWPIMLIGTFICLTLLYYLAPHKKIKFRYTIPGALVATIGLLLLSQLFSLYVQYFARSVSSYKALGTFIIVLFWLNFLSMIALLGGVINATWQDLHTKKNEETKTDSESKT
ncbi:YihY/virulence factor BrkB family protein [Pediococcus claussenii]|uniref:Ribonuclease BN-like family protein n=1 Tax=Pediococcus claussenii (strain ATCC BAA-344 / DSM 14800 / JCM 18046 / KCTC 3811 / LMG 21948 / P06) TaxID=701521 RepID=G8PAW4_PEDCP|nr:YihY/virulence factor BrkB family protein [Pediococcus claussenii]AEV95832.1 Ribonuclease BN-like family protein [Pediococcus claussenii ATCC BAA-344]ANZ69329.1 ribonuclease BN [Pediococcus claussenii]ANZ71149.1 ribonuclease BN [Pediococcus claussenii]KRN20438.1 hypothetical protein IV79_GL000493 [Pediococcus claussenii]